VVVHGGGDRGGVVLLQFLGGLHARGEGGGLLGGVLAWGGVAGGPGVGGDVRDGAGGGVVVDDGALRVLLLSGLAEGVCDAAGRGCLAGEHGRVDVRQRGHGCSPGGGARAGSRGRRIRTQR
jgi:hypothetical protein